MAVEGPVAGRQSGAGCWRQASRDCDLGKLERDIATVPDHLGTDLDKLVAQRGHRQVLDLIGQGQ